MLTQPIRKKMIYETRTSFGANFETGKWDTILAATGSPFFVIFFLFSIRGGQCDQICEISPIWQFITSLWQFFHSLCLIWQNGWANFCQYGTLFGIFSLLQMAKYRKII